ncbi:MAG: methyltransferase domain-containing protein [candidate division Zixibacteria bacterium]|nr:methyltransferase domain-containing protein [candidate division Zixibacteria bacterium]
MTTDNNDWAIFFDGHAPKYNDEPFTKNTFAEVEFIINELQLRPGDTILDVGCGTGRHSVGLAKKGLKVTGIDISGGMLSEAKKASEEAGVTIEFIKADATNFKLHNEYDAAVCLCEGAFSLLGASDDPIEHDLNILRNIHHSLKPAGMFLLTCLSAFKLIRQYTDEDVQSGKFDPLSMTEQSDVVDDMRMRERGYVPTELRMLFDNAGFEVMHIWGGTAGNWGKRAIELDEYEIMVVARRR